MTEFLLWLLRLLYPPFVGPWFQIHRCSACETELGTWESRTGGACPNCGNASRFGSIWVPDTTHIVRWRRDEAGAAKYREFKAVQPGTTASR